LPAQSLSLRTRLPGEIPQLIRAIGGDHGTAGEYLGDAFFGFR
jgi:hypothetical protein